MIEITEQRSELRIQRAKAFEWWEKLQEFCENEFNLAKFLEGDSFEAISFTATVGSCISTFITLFSEEDSSALMYINVIDVVFFGYFCIEICLKLIASGAFNFFQNSWNLFDFTLVLIQVSMQAKL